MYSTRMYIGVFVINFMCCYNMCEDARVLLL